MLHMSQYACHIVCVCDMITMNRLCMCIRGYICLYVYVYCMDLDICMYLYMFIWMYLLYMK